MFTIWKSVLAGCPALASQRITLVDKACRVPREPSLIPRLQTGVIAVWQSTDIGIETPDHLMPLKGAVSRGTSRWLWLCSAKVGL